MEVAEEVTEKTSLKSLLKRPHKTKVAENKLILSLNKRCFVMLQLISRNKFVKTKSWLSRMEHLGDCSMHKTSEVEAYANFKAGERDTVPTIGWQRAFVEGKKEGDPCGKSMPNLKI